MYRHKIILLLLLLFGMKAAAIPLQQYTTTNGLVSNTVYHSFVDSRGFLWIATDKGIARFDGKNFTNFTTLDGLRDNTNFNFFEDHDFGVWPFAFNGQNCRILNTTVGRVPVDFLPSDSYINAMCYDDQGALYVGYYDGDVYKIVNGKSALFYRHVPGDGYVHSLAFEDGMLKLYSNPKWRYFRKGKLVKEVNVGQNSNFYYNGQLCVADQSGIKVYRRDTLIYQYNDREFTSGKIIHLYGDTSGNVFCSTRNGLFVLNRYTHKQYHLLPGQQVYCCVQDKTGDYWISVFNKGIWRMSSAFASFADISGDIAIKKVFHKDGQLFAANDHKTFIVTDAANGSVLRQIDAPFGNNSEPLFYHDNIFICNAVTSTRTATATCFYNTATRQLDTLYPYSRSIVPMGSNLFLLNTYQSLIGVYYDGKQFYKKINHKLNTRSVRICRASGGEAWVLQDQKLYRCDRQFVLHQVAQNAAWLGVKRIQQFYGKLFFMRDTSGVMIYDERTLTPIGGHLLPDNNVVYDIASMPDSTLLFYTLRGAYLLRQKNGTYSFRPLQFPFGTNEYDDVYPVGDQCIFYRQESLYGIGTAQLNKETSSPPLIINSLEINGKKYRPDLPIHIDNVTSCDINLSVSTLYFRGAGNAIQYSLLSGESSDWKSIEGNNLHIQLNNFGNHELRLRSLYENHVPGSEMQTIRISLSPPYYRSRWFFVLIMLFAAVIAAAGIGFYIRKRKKLMINELNYLKMEHKSINSLLNPHFVFNAINNIQSLINTGPREKANDYLATMSTLIRQNIENLQFHFVALANEMDLVHNYIELQNLRFDNKIVLEVEDQNQLSDRIAIPPLLIHTFVENAIVHGFRDKTVPFHIRISIDYCDDEYVLIHIVDNGVGLNKPLPVHALKNKTSLGINFNKRRLERINSFYKLKQSIIVADRSLKGEQGTEVVIVLYQKLALMADFSDA